MTTAEKRHHPPETPKRPRRARRWLKRVAVTLILALGVAVLLATQTNAAGWVILPALESALGCRATAERVRLTLDGRIQIRNLRLEAPGVDGPAARFLEAPELEARPVWSSLLVGRAELSRLSLLRPILRLSQDQALGLNIAGLRPSTVRGTGLLPSVQIVDGVAEYGEHGPGWYTPLTTFHVHGRLARADRTLPRYTVELAEAAGPGVRPAQSSAISIVGEIDLTGPTATIHLANVDLGRFKDAAMPSRVQELWRLMALRGQLNDTVFTYEPSVGSALTFQLREVSLNVPVPIEADTEAESTPSDWDQVGPYAPPVDRHPVTAAARPPLLAPPIGLLAMRRVSGDVRLAGSGMQVALRGAVEDLPCQVTLTTQGYRADSALELRFKSSGFRVADQPRLLPFAPYLVRHNFKRFSGPTAEVDGVVEIRRGPPTPEGAAPLSVRGSMEFKKGAAAFDRFRYPFTDLAGTVLFDDEKVELVTITGRGPTGARLHASGRVAPLNDDPGLDITVTVLDVPMDRHLREAVPPHRRKTLEAMFSSESYERLVASGLIRRPGGAEGAPPGAGAGAPAPVFELGGPSAIVVHVTREPGPGSEYLTDVQVTLPNAGLLPEAFPYPVVADSLRLHLTDEWAEADAPAVRGLSGAVGAMHAEFELEPPGSPDRFTITAWAQDVSLDPLLVQALPDERRGGETGGRGWSARQLVSELVLSGKASCNAKVFTHPEGDTGWDIGVDFGELRAQPGGAELVLEDVSGSLALSDERIRVTGLEGRIGEGRFRMELTSEGPRLAGDNAAALSLRAACDRFPLGAPIEELVSVIAPERGAALAGLRREYGPSGEVNADFMLSDGPRGIDYRLSVREPNELSFDLLGSRLVLTDPTGRASVTPRVATLDSFASELRWGEAPCGRLTLNGEWAIGDTVSTSMDLSLVDGKLQAPIVRAIASRADPALGRWMEEGALEGAFSCEGRVLCAPGSPPAFEGAIVPVSLAMTRGGTRIEFPEVSGRLTMERGGGRIEALRGVAPAWTVSADGSWTARPGFEMDLDLSVDAEGLPPELLAIMPERASGALRQTELSIGGRFHVEHATLRYRASPGEGESQAIFNAAADFQDASLHIGVPLTGVTGRATIEADLPPGPATPRVRIDLSTDGFVAAGVPLTAGRIRLVSGEVPGLFVMPLFRASAHGGEISATAALWSPDSAPASGGAGQRSAAAASRASGTRYEADLRLSSVDFASLLRDLGAAPSGSEAVSSAAGGGGERGVLDGSFAVAGVIGDDGAKRGRGLLRVQGGQVLALPGLVGLLRLSNLQAPINERLEYASAGFHLRGSTITFEHIEASSDSLTIAGTGTMQWPSTALDLRFNTHGERHIPLLSDLFEGLRNELITTVVRGTAREPEYQMVQLPATTRMLGTIFRGRPRRGTDADASPPASAKVEP